LAIWWTIWWTIYRIDHEVMVGWGVSRLVSTVFFYKGFLPFLSRERKGSQKEPPASRFILRASPRQCSARDKGKYENQKQKIRFETSL
jgi:hypothetical protein